MNTLYDALDQVNDVKSELKYMIRILDIMLKFCDVEQSPELHKQTWIMKKWMKRVKKQVNKIVRSIEKNLELG